MGLFEIYPSRTGRKAQGAPKKANSLRFEEPPSADLLAGGVGAAVRDGRGNPIYSPLPNVSIFILRWT
jgi:hypothetical protein